MVLGVGVAFKYTIATYAIGLGLAFPLYSRSFMAFLREGIIWGVGVITGILTTGGVWMLRLWIKFQNPLFPFFNHIFKSPYTEPTGHTDDRFLPSNIKRVLFYPYYFTYNRLTTMEWPFQDLRLAFIHFLLGLAVAMIAMRWIFSRRSPLSPSPVTLTRVWLIVFFVISYMVWEAKFSIYRYLAPLEQLAPIAIVILLGALFSVQRHVLCATAAVFVVLVVTTRPPRWDRIPWGATYVDATVPALSDASKAVVLITSSDPLGYLVPSFPASVRFVRIESNLLSPTNRNKMTEEIDARLKEIDRDYYLLTSADELKSADKLLAFYNLETRVDSTVPILTNGDDEVRFCRLRRRSSP